MISQNHLDYRPPLFTRHQSVVFGAVAGSSHTHALLWDESSSPEPDIAVVLQALLTLDTQCPRFQRCMAELQSGFVPDDPASVDAVTDVADALRHIVGAYSQLRGRVIAFDRVIFGDGVKSFGELGLRGQRLIIAMCMRGIRTEMESVTGRVACERALRVALGNTFVSFDDMAAFVAQELMRIMSVWLPWRNVLLSHPLQVPESPQGTYQEHKMLYLAAIQTAQYEMNRLNRGKFGDVLRAGMQCTSPAFRRACLRMRVAMQTCPMPELELGALVAAAGAAMWRAEPQRAQG